MPKKNQKQKPDQVPAKSDLVSVTCRLPREVWQMLQSDRTLSLRSMDKQLLFIITKHYAIN